MPPPVPNESNPSNSNAKNEPSSAAESNPEFHYAELNSAEFNSAEFNPAEFNPEDRRFLLHAAHASIEAALAKKEISPDIGPTAFSSRLNEKRGVFTTIYWKGNLRGCVGHILPLVPLVQSVMETAQAAAFHDPRFSPLTREELPDITISLSILSALQPIQPEQIEIGQHGLLVSLGMNRGLLLPQIPVEHGWDCLTFLEQTCHKAGLPENAWKKGATIQAFTAEVFGDEDNG